MSDVVVECAFFFCSYVPLFVILAIRFERLYLSVVCAAIAAAGLVSGFGVIRAHRRIARARLTLRTVEDRGGETFGYVASYLLPFVTVAEPGWRDLLGYGLFLLVVGVIYVRSSLVQLNPTLYLAGWRIDAIEIGPDSWTGYLITRRRVRRGEQLTGVRLTERLYIDYERRSHAE